MSKEKSIETVAAIDLGSNYTRMTIAEVNAEGDMKILEDVSQPSEVGKDTFSQGRISTKTIQHICNDLKGYVQLMKDYRVKQYKAVATSGIREAENKQYILEQVRLRTGIKVEAINAAQERFYQLKAVKNNASYKALKKNSSTLIVNINSDYVEASLYDSGVLQFSEIVKTGSLRLREYLNDLEAKTAQFPKIMEQYIQSKLYFAKNNIQKYNIENFFAVGGEINLIKDILMSTDDKKKVSDNCILNTDFFDLCEKAKDMSYDQLRFTYDIQMKKAELLLPTLLIINSFFQITSAKKVYVPRVSLRDGIIENLVDELFKLKRAENDVKDAISSIRYIGEKYGVDIKHTNYVEKMALSIFDQTQKLHKLSERERLYLQAASILHDIGNFMNTENHSSHSYNIIHNQNVIGFSNREIELVANIAKYHEEDIPSQSHANYRNLADNDKMVVSTLSAILKLSESLDSSHLQKIKAVKLIINNDMVYFNIEAKDEFVLEQLNFNNNAVFFEEVLGVKPLI